MVVVVGGVWRPEVLCGACVCDDCMVYGCGGWWMVGGVWCVMVVGIGGWW